MDTRRGTRDAYDAHAADYLRRSPGYGWAEPLLGRFRAHLAPPARVAALGCGPGPELLALQRAGYLPVGLDDSTEVLRLARSTGTPIVSGDLCSLPMRGETFGGAWASASLLHLERQRVPLALAEMRRILVPGGVAFLGLKTGQGERWEEADLGRRFFSYHRPEAIAALCRRSGLEPVEQVELMDPAGREWFYFFLKRGASPSGAVAD